MDFQKKITDTVRNEIADKFEFLAERKQSEFLYGFLNKKDGNELADTMESGNFYNIRNTIQNKFTNVQKHQKISGMKPCDSLSPPKNKP